MKPTMLTAALAVAATALFAALMMTLALWALEALWQPFWVQLWLIGMAFGAVGFGALWVLRPRRVERQGR